MMLFASCHLPGELHPEVASLVQWSRPAPNIHGLNPTFFNNRNHRKVFYSTQNKPSTRACAGDQTQAAPRVKA